MTTLQDDDQVAPPLSIEYGTYRTVQARFWPLRGTVRVEDAAGTPTQRHISPSVLVCEVKVIITFYDAPSSLGSGDVLYQCPPGTIYARATTLQDYDQVAR